MLKSRHDIGNASLAIESSDRKRKTAGKQERVKEALKRWFTKVKEKYTRVTGPLLRLKAEEFANNTGKNDFVHICLYLFIHVDDDENVAVCAGARESNCPDRGTRVEFTVCLLYRIMRFYKRCFKSDTMVYCVSLFRVASSCEGTWR